MFSEIWSKKRCSLPNSSKISDDNKEQGLRILTKIACVNSNVVIKPIFLPTKSACYLNSCHLCHKHLPLDKEIYMYRGDLGFCSVECRDRQIYLDETKELELSTKRIFSSFRHRSRDGPLRCDTKDFRRRHHHPFSSSKNKVVFS